MDDWLHVYSKGCERITGKPFWLMRSGGSARALLKSTNKSWVLFRAKHFAAKHKMMFFQHDLDDVIQSVANFRDSAMDVSKDFKTYYNETMTNKLTAELPNIATSKNISRVHVRARFKDSEEPECLNVHVELYDGKKLKFKVGRYMFPDDELRAKISLLM